MISDNMKLIEDQSSGKRILLALLGTEIVSSLSMSSKERASFRPFSTLARTEGSIDLTSI